MAEYKGPLILPFDESWLSYTPFDQAKIDKQCETYNAAVLQMSKEQKKERLLKIIQLIDLTTLSGDDTPQKVVNLADQAMNPIPNEIKSTLKLSENITCAAVCVYPARICDLVEHLKKVTDKKRVKIASVAGGFPSGQYKMASKLLEIKLAVEDGANEIDIVISRPAALLGNWQTVYNEVKQMKLACGNEVHLKTILATGELLNNENIYKASVSAMLAGSDFIKTSTGKENVNATLQVSVVMCQAIKTYFEKTHQKVGFKPAGGIRTADEALAYYCLVEDILGADWLNSSLFRIGASTLLTNIVIALENC